jgi:hypothetical protein
VAGHCRWLNGLDSGFNALAAACTPVVHGADYVGEAFIKQNGFLGRSQGCPALFLELYVPIIDTLKGGAGMFVLKSGAGYSPFPERGAGQRGAARRFARWGSEGEQQPERVPPVGARPRKLGRNPR